MLDQLIWHECNPQGLACFCWHRRRANRSASCWTAWCEASPPAEARLDCSHSCQVSSKEEDAVLSRSAGPTWEGCWAPFYWKTEAGFLLKDYWDHQYLLFQLTTAIFILELRVILATTSPAPLESIFVPQNPPQREELSWNPIMTDSCFSPSGVID